MQQRDHYAVLDGLRGLAALSILFFHLGQWQQHQFLARNAFLSVDFFFCLSGYVLALAYGSKLKRGMSAWTFVQVRLIRLMPIIVLGTLASAAYLFARVLLLHDPNIDVGQVSFAAFLGVLCMPMFTASQAIGGPQIFPLNGPQFTLFLELVVNVFWAVTKRVDAFWTAVLMAVTGYTLTAFYGLSGDDVQNFWKGFPRVFGAFYAGVALFHVQLRWPSLTGRGWRLLFWPLLFVTAILFWWPVSATHWVRWGWSFAFAPLLVLSGSRVQLNAVSRRIALVLGELSYPVYALHYPIFVWVNAVYQQMVHRKDFMINTALVVPSVLICSWLLLRWFDQPIRRRLTYWAIGGRKTLADGSAKNEPARAYSAKAKAADEQ